MMFSPVDSAIFAIINETDKRVYVGYSARLHKRLGIILSEILSGDWKYKQMIEDKGKLEFKILDHNTDKVFVKYFIVQYVKMGYSIYNDSERIPLEYKFRIEFGKEQVLVCAVNKRNEKEILGKFSMYQEAQEFLDYINRNNPARNLVYKV